MTRLEVVDPGRIPPPTVLRVEQEHLSGDPSSQEVDNEDRPLWVVAGEYETPPEAGPMVEYDGAPQDVDLEAGGRGGYPQEVELEAGSKDRTSLEGRLKTGGAGTVQGAVGIGRATPEAR